MEDKLKFLMVTTFYPPYNFGGDGIFVYRLSNELARRGHTVDIIHCIDSYKILERKDPGGECTNHPNITVHSLKSRCGFLSPLLTHQTSYPFFKSKEIKSLITEKEFDVIHYHNMSLIGLNVIPFGDAIKLYTLHEYWLICPRHTLLKYGRQVCEKSNCFLCQIVGRRPIQWWRSLGIMQKALSHIDAFISPSIFTKKKYQEHGLNAPVVFIPNFFPTSASNDVPPEDSSFQYTRPYFLFVGRLEKIKGVQNLIPIFSRYRKCVLLVAGDGEYARSLRHLAAGVQNIKFLGCLSYKKLRSLYRDALAVIVPSVWCEVFGLIVIEAFAKRTPVIVNNSGALAELVTQSGGGFIYNNADQLIEYMEKLRLDPNLRNLLGAKGYQSYRKYYTEQYYIKRYYNLFQELAARQDLKDPAVAALQNELEKQTCCERLQF